jgi:redox-sensitive bicupin YhaK (pirin superfamily)
VIHVRRAAERYVSTQPGITTYHCFAAGPHYDPDNVSFGPVVGVDEHLVQAGAGFDWHAHRGVTIVTWVLEGTLRHEDEDGERLVHPGELFVQSTGQGIRHSETNASDSKALRFVQTTLLSDSAGVRVAAGATEIHGHAYVVRGEWRLGDEQLGPGDSVRAEQRTRIAGRGELLVVDLAERF